MNIDLVKVAARASRLNKPEDFGTRMMLENMVPIHTRNQFNQERHDKAMAIATAPRDPKYWAQANEISKKIIEEVGKA